MVTSWPTISPPTTIFASLQRLMLVSDSVSSEETPFTTNTLLDGGNNLPSLWVFLLIVLGILIFIIGSTSFTMHWIQRKRRDRLRRRVADGEVDLEALGIKRLTVPQEVLDKMPLYTYTGPAGSKELGAPPLTRLGTTETRHKATLERSLSSPIEESPSLPQTATPANPLHKVHSTHFSQPTCAICLDDFVSSDTIVRELPCRHIFHPECIDSFLRENSSLCPMCKKTVLPKGYCPAAVTNAMVRRERMVRRMRERIPDNESVSNSNFYSMARIRGAARTFATGGLRSFTAPSRSELPLSSVEMGSATNVAPIVAVASQSPSVPGSSLPIARPASPEPPPPPDSNSHIQTRREWARSRAVAMLGSRVTPSGDEIEADDIARRSGWRKVVGKIWPGLA
jgi:hypothetical protein